MISQEVADLDQALGFSSEKQSDLHAETFKRNSPAPMTLILQKLIGEYLEFKFDHEKGIVGTLNAVIDDSQGTWIVITPNRSREKVINLSKLASFSHYDDSGDGKIISLLTNLAKTCKSIISPKNKE